ncbi:serine hydrolase domain-containing protein [Maribacter sp. 2210JD10-5]|uniref:serine hydrolase domain-containing protein n=1 Tax=Maribacter sp. 2210JD10-5 TaxID=3386272 RepID=UPI0039BC7CBF
MRHYRILIGTILVVLILPVITASKIHSNEATIRISKSISYKKEVDKKAIALYASKKQKLKTALEEYFNKAIASGTIVGAGVSIVQGDSIVISDGFGKRSVNNKSKVNGETVFRLGSLSKGFAGVLAASLEAEGKLDWDDKVVDYIPEFQFGDRSNTKKVRLSHILSHSSGTPYHSFTNLVEAGLSVSSIAKRFDEVTPISEPGSVYSYQNAMFSLSQEVMEKICGEDIKTQLKNQFFSPLGMSTISMDHDSLLEVENVAMPHVRSRRGWKKTALRNKYYNAVAAGGINASSLDMAKWMRFLLGHNPEVLQPKVIEKAFSPFIEIPGHSKYYQRWANHKQSYYGFGWRIHEFEDAETQQETKVWHHGGSVNNYRNEIALFPETDLGICVLLNGNSRLARTVIPDLRKIIERIYNTETKNVSL